MEQMTERLMFQAEFLLSRGEYLEVFYIRGERRHKCQLTGRGTASDAGDCFLVRLEDGYSARVSFEYVRISSSLANRLTRMADEADSIMRYRQHRAHTAGSRKFWEGLRKTA